MVALVLAGVFCAGPVKAVKTISSADVIFQYMGPDSMAYMGRYMNCLGDINGDGYSDIALCSWNANNAKTYVFFGGNSPDTIPDMILKGSSGPPAAIDLDGDGINEVITADEVGIGGTETGSLYFYKGYGDSIGSVPYDSMRPDTGNWAFGWDFRTAFADSDSLGDLLALQYRRDPQQIQLFFGAPTLDTTADWTYEVPTLRQLFYGDFGFIDYDGDGNLDIYAAQSMRDPGLINIFLGPDYGATPDIIIDRPMEFNTLDSSQFGYGTYNIGDFDGDGWADFGVRWVADGFVYRCGPGTDTLYDYHLHTPCGYMAAAGDVNDDGYNDLITGGAYLIDGSVQIYLGGPKADTTYDLLLTYAKLPGLPVENIGYRVGAAGDMNGDGIDDFMLACETFIGGERGAVVVVRGSRDIVSSVEDRPESLIPTRFELKQNYPNPFNTTTQIQFTLPTRQHVRLSIYNILGNEVRVLVDKELSAGAYLMEWDGTDKIGRAVASGAYMYKLTADEVVQSKKMILLK